MLANRSSLKKIKLQPQHTLFRMSKNTCPLPGHRHIKPPSVLFRIHSM